MASGKSLELAAIKVPEPRVLCICGKIWREHFSKDGSKMLAKYKQGMHHPLNAGERSRAQRRAKKRRG